MKYRKFAMSLFALLVLMAAGFAIGQPADKGKTSGHSASQSSGSQREPQSLGPQAADVQLLEKYLQLLVKEQVNQSFQESGREIAARAEGIESRADKLIDFMHTWLVLVTLLFLGLLFFGWQEGRLLRGARRVAERAREQAEAAVRDAVNAAKGASESAEAVKKVEEEAGEAGKRVRATDEAVRKSIIELPKSQLPLLRTGAVGAAPIMPQPEELARFEEADVLVILVDKTNPQIPEGLADLYVRLGQYWRRIRNQVKAMARFRRAMELDPNLLEARRGLCGAMYNASIIPDNKT